MDISDRQVSIDEQAHYCWTREFATLCELAALTAIRRLRLGRRVAEQEIVSEIWRRYVERHGQRETWKTGDVRMVLLANGPKKVIIVLWGLGMDVLKEMTRVWRREETLNGDGLSSRRLDNQRSVELREWIDGFMTTLSEKERETLRAYEGNDFERKQAAVNLKITLRHFSRRLGAIREKTQDKRWEMMS